MFMLKLTHKGNPPVEYLLTEKQELWIGRNKKNFISLKSSYGISRKHLKISKTDEKSWKIECKSKLGGLLFKGKQVSHCQITTGDTFSLQDYHFELISQSPKEKPLSGNTEDLLNMEGPEEPFGADAPEEKDLPAEEPSLSPKENTEDLLGMNAPEEKDLGVEESSLSPKENTGDPFSAQAPEEKNLGIEESSLSPKESTEDPFTPEKSPFDKAPEEEDKNPQDPFEQAAPSNNFEEANSQSSIMTEATTVMNISQSHLKPCLVISLSENEEDQTAALEHGDKWIVGRDPSCDICVEDINISRQHFYITKKNSQYFITDLGSSNGTCLNDKLLKPRQASLLKSGAVISILEIEMYFEIRNPKVQKKINNLPAPLLENASSQNAPPLSLIPDAPPPAIHQPVPNVIMSETIVTPLPPSHASKKKRIFLIIAVLALIGAVFFLSKDKKEDKETQTDIADPTDPFRVLNPETQEQVKDLYALAEQQYQMKKFELCYQTLEKMHAIVPYHDQSKSLIITCRNGAESIRMQKEMEVSRRKEEKNKKEMLENIESCKSKFDTFQSMDELTKCLHKARTIDPENSEIAFLISKFETKELLKEEKRRTRMSEQKRINTLLGEYNQAKKLKEQNKLLKAIPAYKSFLSKKHPAKIAQTVQTAQTELTSMEEEITSKTQLLLDKCQQLVDSKNYKEAYTVCQEVFTVVPAHQLASTHIQTAVESINNTLKPLYNESVLNESLGQIEIAKKQWQSIMDQDIPNGEYYNKAAKKLSKY